MSAGWGIEGRLADGTKHRAFGSEGRGRLLRGLCGVSDRASIGRAIWADGMGRFFSSPFARHARRQRWSRSLSPAGYIGDVGQIRRFGPKPASGAVSLVQWVSGSPARAQHCSQLGVCEPSRTLWNGNSVHIRAYLVRLRLHSEVW